MIKSGGTLIMKNALSRTKAKYSKAVKYIGLLLLISSLVLAVFTIVSAGYTIVENTWIKKISYNEEPIDITVSGNHLYVLTTRNNSIVITKISREYGEVSWRTIWSVNENIVFRPLKILVNGDNILIPILYRDRHTLLVLVYSFDGTLVKKILIELKKDLEWIYDVDIHSNYLVIVGARYKAGERLQYFLEYYNLRVNRAVWNSTWGNKDIDYLFSVCVSPSSGVVYVLGNSTTMGYTIHSISFKDGILWSYRLGENIDSVPSMYCYLDRIYLLVTYRNKTIEFLTLSAIKPAILQSKVVDIAGLNDFMISGLSASKNYIVFSGTGYNLETLSYDALIYISPLQGGKGKIVWIGGKGFDLAIKSIIEDKDGKNELYSLALVDNYIIVARHEIYSSSLNIVNIASLTATAFIGTYIFLRFRKSW